MNCATHPDAPAAAFCRDCGKPMCPDCQRPALGSIYCAEHLPVTVAASPYTAPTSTTSVAVDYGAHPVLALILGFIPGVGAIYNGQYAKGLIHAVVFGLLVSLASSTRGPFEPLIGLLIAAWVFYMAFEAYHTARNRRHGVPVEDFSGLFDVRPTQGRFPAGAILLIALGVLLLLDTTGIISIEELGRYWPVGLIVCGIYMLYMRAGARAHNTDHRADNAGARR